MYKIFLNPVQEKNKEPGVRFKSHGFVAEILLDGKYFFALALFSAIYLKLFIHTGVNKVNALKISAVRFVSYKEKE